MAAVLTAILGAIATNRPMPAAGIEPLVVNGNRFENSAGVPARFWGMNLVAFYPTHAQADAIAANLASREVNVVRPHHNLRSSPEWNPVSGIPALVTYVGNTRTPHAEAWDRFDYLNAQLRARGIYLVLSLHSSRRFLAGDVDILATDDTDRANWMSAMTGLNAASNNLDLFKILPMIDERAARLMEEFAQQLLTHVNPYTGLAYGNDPQVLYLETMNETSTEYAIIAGNKFPASAAYWGTSLQAKWDAYTAAHGVTPCDLYAAGIGAQRQARSAFLRGLDIAYANRMRTFVGNLGSQRPIAFSNLWRGDTFQKVDESLSDVVEEHDYDDPFVPRTYVDAFSYFARSTPAAKPYFIGELNQTQTDAAMNANAPFRATLQLAASAYGSFNEWSGVTWFAWAHGDKMVGNDGWSIWEERRPAVNGDLIGQLESDGVMLDHLRTAGMLFKRRLIAPSTAPILWTADDPLGGNLNYPDLMTPKYPFQAGWQNIHAVKRVFGPVPPTQPSAPWMTTAPANPLVSDTNEIRKDVTRQQLTVSAPQAEAFSGKLDAAAPAGLTHLGLGATSGSATVILVAADGQPLATSANLILSRTYFDAANNEVANPVTTIAGLQPPAGNNVWHLQRTRPRGETGYEPLTMVDGVLTLPSDGWHEAELVYAAAGSLPPRRSLTQPGDLLRPIFDDAYRIAGVLGTAQGGFTRNAQGVIDPSTILMPPEGAKSLRMKFTAGFDPCVLGINFTNSASQATALDLSGWRATHGLRFWVYTKRVAGSFAVELAALNGTQLVEVRLPLSRYLAPSDYGNKWVELTIPFTDFPATDGTGATFLWNQVKGVGFYCSTVADGYYDPYIDNLRIVRTAGGAPVVPAAPSGLLAIAGDGRVDLSWSVSTGATSYYVKRALTSAGPFAAIGNPAAASFADTTAINGTTYFYVVSAANAAGESGDSAAVSATPRAVPAAPTGLAAIAGNAQVALTWNVVAGATSYQVKRATTSGGPFAILASSANPSFTDSTVTNGTNYHYVVSALNGAAESADSLPVSATPQAPPPAPVNLAANAGDGQVTLGWAAVTGATSYNVKRASTSGGPYTTLASAPTTTHVDTAVTNGATYYYVVSAVNAAGEGADSAEIGATPMPAAVPAVPAGVMAIAGNGQVSVSWNGMAGATSYRLKRATAAGGPFATIATPLFTSVSDASVANGTTYYYVVSALNAAGESADSAPASATPQGPAYATVISLVSIGAQDGFTQESSQTSNVGGGFNATSATSQAMIIGDTNSNRQNKTIVSFDTSAIPAGAKIFAATLKLRRSALTGGNPFLSLGNCYVDLKASPGFGDSTVLAASDFQAPADVTEVAIMSAPPNNLDFSFGSLTAAGIAAISRTGETQLRVYFAIGDNNNNSNDYMAFYSGENPTPANRPILEITYLLPPAIAVTSPASGTFGVPFSTTITVTNGATSVGATGLPPGLVLNAATGEISGTPTAAGDFVVGLSATNAAGTTTGSLTLSIAQATASVALDNLSQVYDGAAKVPTATTQPAGLSVRFTYDGAATAPVDAGTYGVAATVDDPNYRGSATGTLTITKAPAAVSLANASTIYDGSPKSLTASTSPAGLSVRLTYNGDPSAPVNAGSYAVVAAIDEPNYFGSASATLTIARATATLALGGLQQAYDGTPRVVTAATAPANLRVNLTYDATPSAPIYPGTYAVVATIDEQNYQGAVGATLVVTTTGIVRHAPVLNGDIDGSLHLLTHESVTLNSQTAISGDLLVPGSPDVLLNGAPTYGSTIDGPGNAAGTNYTVTLNRGSVLRHVVRRIDPLALPIVAAPPAPSGTRDVTLNAGDAPVGDFAAVRNLTLNGSAGLIAVPPGTYGTFTANSGSGFVLGFAGATEPAIYNLQSLALNSSSTLQVAGPVILTLANGATLNAPSIGNAANPAWLRLRVSGGDVTLNSGVTLHGHVTAPASAVILNGTSTLHGGVASDRLILNSGGLLSPANP